MATISANPDTSLASPIGFEADVDMPDAHADFIDFVLAYRLTATFALVAAAALTTVFAA